MGKWPDTSPEMGEDGWVEHFNSYTKSFGILKLKYWWSMDQKKSPGYAMSINTYTLKSTKPDHHEAKKFLIEQAKKYMKQALELLEKEDV